jgi:hypothetical protein
LLFVLPLRSNSPTLVISLIFNHSITRDHGASGDFLGPCPYLSH